MAPIKFAVVSIDRDQHLEVAKHNLVAAPSNIAAPIQQLSGVNAIDVVRTANVQRNRAILINPAPDCSGGQPPIPGTPFNPIHGIRHVGKG